MMHSATVYDLGTRLLPYLPPSPGYRLCDHLSLLAPLVPAWPHILLNLRHVLPDATDSTRRRVGRQVIAGLLKNYYDLLRAHAVSPAELARTVEARGLGNLEGALAQGKGVLVAMPHMGNFSLISEPVAAMVKRSITIVVEQLRDPAIHTLLNGLRRRANIELVDIGPQAVRAVMRALRAGSIVVLLSDRTVAETTVDVAFFGEPATVPSGPATLALRTGAPLLTAYTYRLPTNRSRVVIDPPLRLERRGELAADVQRVMQAVMRVFETYIRRHPGQWLLTEPVWKTR